MARRAPMLALFILHVDTEDEPEARAIFGQALAAIGRPACDITCEPYAKLGPHARVSGFLALGMLPDWDAAKAEIARIVAALVHPDDVDKGANVDAPNDDGTGICGHTQDGRGSRFLVPRTIWFHLELNTYPPAQADLRRMLRRRGALA